MHTNVFGLPIKYAAWSHQDDLPLYIAGSYDFYTASYNKKKRPALCINRIEIKDFFCKKNALF